jgi:hypothetical protein
MYDLSFDRDRKAGVDSEVQAADKNSSSEDNLKLLTGVVLGLQSRYYEGASTWTKYSCI